MTNRKMKIAALKARLKRQVKIDKAVREANLKKWPPPRYDDVYFEGVEWLDKNG